MVLRLGIGQGKVNTYGVSITNIDSPGWALTVELVDTYLYGVEFQTVEIQREEDDDWFF